MKQLVVLSGKGGTGKTTVAAALAHLAAATQRLVIADADVDAANLGLVLAPTLQAVHAFDSGEVAVVDPAACTGCGECAAVCRFEAFTSTGGIYTVDPLACEGCAACFYACPAGAIRMVLQRAGEWYEAQTRFGPLYHAHLFAGQENSGKLVTLVKQQARLRGFDDEADLLLVDGPPGIGCPAIAALAGADAALIVTEPTVAGAHDMARVVGLAEHFRVPTAVLINKADLNPAQTEALTAFCIERDIPLAGRIPFDPTVTEAMVRGQPITESGGPVTEALHTAWADLQAILSAGL